MTEDGVIEIVALVVFFGWIPLLALGKMFCMILAAWEVYKHGRVEDPETEEDQDTGVAD